MELVQLIFALVVALVVTCQKILDTEPVLCYRQRSHKSLTIRHFRRGARCKSLTTNSLRKSKKVLDFSLVMP